MQFKLIIEDNNTQKGQEIKYKVSEGVEMVAHFFGFAVFMRPEGCVLVLPKQIRDNIKNMTPDQDRILCLDPNDPNLESNRNVLRNASLNWYPKDEVEPEVDRQSNDTG